MFSKESPFFTISKNIQGNNLVFHNDSSNNQKDSNLDFFSIEDKNKQFKTKGKFEFYNNGTPSQVKQYLDYFLKESDDKINLICYKGNNFPQNLLKNENPKNLISLSSNDFNNQQPSINSNLNGNCKNMNKEIIEDDGDSLCPAPLSKKSFNSNLSGSTFNSSYNSINNNLCNEKNEDHFNSFVNEIRKMDINEKKVIEKKSKFNNPYMTGRVLKLNIEY
jgi:hypothetical protein